MVKPTKTTTPRKPAKAATATKPAKTAAAKTAPTKATPAQATPKPADTPTPAAQPGFIDFRGRAMAVRYPTGEQLAVWNRTAGLLQTARPDMPHNEALNLLSRGQRLIASVLTDQADRDWLDDQYLEDLTLLEAATILTKAVDAYKDMKPAPSPRNGPQVTRQRR